ncbi:DUF305 domain-containing protein [candidate division WOR-3 bacterium]|nr:DUF305 domain-containing protein [candidate division WOR-3 bacterium]
MKHCLPLEAWKVWGVTVALLAVACAPRSRPAVPYDLRFIDAMIAHHQGAIDMSQPADSNAMHPELKDFARKVIEDQSLEIALMTQWRDQWFPGRPKTPNIMEMPGMAMSMMDMSPDHMQQLKGAAFDRMFIEMMVPHHEGAITMARDALAKSQRPEIRELAQRIIDAQQGEIEMMARWQSEWRNLDPSPGHS